MKTMSDFIMEQEVTDITDGSTVDVLHGFMEMNAIAAVAECYCEHAAIAQFANETGLNIFTESDENIFKKAWEGVKSFFSMIWDWLKAIVKAVISIFKQTSLEKCIEQLKKMLDDNKEMADKKCDFDGRACDALAVMELVYDFKEAVTVTGEATDTTVSVKKMESFIEKAKNWKDEYKKDKKGDFGGAYVTDSLPDNPKMTNVVRTKSGKGFHEGTWGDLLTILLFMREANIPSRGAKLLKQIDFDKNKVKAAKGDTEKAVITAIKKAANALAKVYDLYQSSTIKMVKKLLNKEIRDQKLKELETRTKEREEAHNATKTMEKSGSETTFASRKTESYEENTDGYYFL